MIAAHLQVIKSAGVYRFVFDKSEVTSTLSQTLRLVVGYSEKGPFNTVTLIKSVNDFKSVYGNGSRKLEKKGIWFHRLAEQALSTGPILCLNLKNFNDEKVEGISIDPSASTHATIDAKITEIYNTNRLWSLDPEVLTEVTGMDGVMSFVHTDTDKTLRSIFIRPSTSTNFDITLNDWYKTYTKDEAPDYLETNLDDKLIDYMADVFIFEGVFDATIAATDTYSKYFDVDGTKVVVKPFITNSFGDKVDTLESLAQLDGSGFITKYTGSTIPYIRNLDGSYLALDLQMNRGVDVHKLMMYLDVNKLEESSDAASLIKLDNTTGVLGQIYVDGDLNHETFIVNARNAVSDLTKVVVSYGQQLAVGDKLTYNSLTATVTAFTGLTATLDGEFNIGESIYVAINVERPTTKKYLEVVPMILKGYTFDNAKPISNSITDKLTWQKSLIKSLIDYRGLHEALTNKIDVQYRYLVDTFESYPDEEIKSVFTTLCKEKENAFAILNFPSMKSFTKNDLYKTNGIFDMSLIPKGGNGAIKFSLPTDLNGSSFGAFYSELKFRENGLKKDVPSAALISNLFADKYVSRKPYFVVAGPTFGRLQYTNLIGPDYNFGRNDLDLLEPFGINCLVYTPQYGTYINANQTAKQKPLTSLSKINVRELVIFLQNEVASLLESYQWGQNTNVLREAIKLKADTICERIKLNGGLYEYTNQCDDLNNTPEVIQNEMLILTTEIEPSLGAGKMVHELTIHKTGQLSSTEL